MKQGQGCEVRWGGGSRGRSSRGRCTSAINGCHQFHALCLLSCEVLNPPTPTPTSHKLGAVPQPHPAPIATHHHGVALEHPLPHHTPTGDDSGGGGGGEGGKGPPTPTPTPPLLTLSAPYHHTPVTPARHQPSGIGDGGAGGGGGGGGGGKCQPPTPSDSTNAPQQYLPLCLRGGDKGGASIHIAVALTTSGGGCTSGTSITGHVAHATTLPLAVENPPRAPIQPVPTTPTAATAARCAGRGGCNRDAQGEHSHPT